MANTVSAVPRFVGQPRNRSASPMCWLLGFTRAALASACIGLADVLPQHLPSTAPRLQVAASVLCVLAGFGLMILAADAVRERSWRC